MKQIQKYIVWASILALTTHLAALLGIFSVGGWTTKLAGLIPSLSSHYLPNIVFALWLSFVASQQSLSKLIWALFGFAFGIIAVGIFYILLIYYNVLTIKKSIAK